MPPSTVQPREPLTPIHLERPPEVVRAGVGRHGTSGLVDRFSLPELWSLHLYSYRATLLVEGRPYEIRPNDVSLVPPQSKIEYRYLGPSQHLYAHLRIEPHGKPTSLPIVQPAGAESPVLTALMTGAVDSFPTGSEQAQANVWAVLWRLEAMARSLRDAHRSRYVADAITYLEANLARPVTVPEVAAHLGISHNHLTRLFQAELDSSVVGYLRTARMALASHLLRDSTMSIAAVATTVGIRDLQAFNKACRRVLGASPREVRATGL
ncbi:MAG: AraC family transcriptional regulator [Propionibacteriaceae bacterium]